MLKVKHERTADCVVGGFREHKDGGGVGSLLLGLYDEDGALNHVGVASGFAVALRKSLVDDLAPYRVEDLEGHPWRAMMSDADGTRRPGAPSRWNANKDLSWQPLRPELVCEVGYDHLQGRPFPPCHVVSSLAARSTSPARAPTRSSRRPCPKSSPGSSAPASRPRGSGSGRAPPSARRARRREGSGTCRRTRASGPASAARPPGPSSVRSTRSVASSRNRTASSRSAASRAASFGALRTARRRSSVPVGDVVGNGVDMAVMGEHGRGRLAAPAGQAREAVGAVADESQPVGYRRRANPVARPDTVVVGDHPRAAVELDDAMADDALGEVLVGGADQHLVDATVVRRHRRRRREGVVGLELDHRPDPNAEGLEGLLEQGELGPELRSHLGTRLVAGPQVVAKRLDDVIGGDPDVGDALGEERRHRPEHAPRRSHLGPVVGSRGRPAEELAEELVGAVDQVDLHGASLPGARRSSTELRSPATA